MERLINMVKYALHVRKELPFSVYTCLKEQKILNVPIINPVLIFILSGVKELGKAEKIICPTGSFVFLTNSPTINMRNIPKKQEYFALLIELESQDFNFIKEQPTKPKKYIRGDIDLILENTLQQFIEWSLYAPIDMWSHRRQEILRVLHHLGYKDVCANKETTTVSEKLREIVSKNISSALSTNFLCEQLAMSESTLRRKLKHERTSVQEIKNQVKLSHALHLVQSTIEPIGYIAEKCGYQSQSRFTEKFKQLFRVTPSQLRKTQMDD